VIRSVGEWDGLLDWLRERALAGHRINATDVASLHIVADPHDVVRIVTAARDGQRTQARHRPRRA
jgi:predicted Rossmann-fold nucleotide-binding protein